jgi:hypothetical protein
MHSPGMPGGALVGLLIGLCAPLVAPGVSGSEAVDPPAAALEAVFGSSADAAG